jgi:hypothetical protein
MQWHWGNIGSALAGISAAISAAIIAVVTLIRGPAALRDWQARQRAQAGAAKEEAETTRLERRRGLSGWSAMGVSTPPPSLDRPRPTTQTRLVMVPPRRGHVQSQSEGSGVEWGVRRPG